MGSRHNCILHRYSFAVPMLHSRSAIDPDIGPYIDPDGECVSAEKKSEVEMEVRDNGSVFWDDQISGIAVPMLFLVGLKEAYENGKDHAWIGKIQDDGLQIAVNSFSDVQIRIAELIMFEDKSVPDILRMVNIDMKRLNTELFMMHDLICRFV